MKQQFFVDTAGTFRTYVYENNRKVVPASAAITITRPGSDAPVVEDVAMTVGADGLLSYDLTAAQNSEAGLNYKAAVSYVHDGKTWYVALFYDVVRSVLTKVITDSDIVTELPQLKDNGWKVRGTAQSGSATTVVDAELKRYEDDYFTGGIVWSADKDETREVVDFESSTGTVTTTAFSSAVTTDRYVLTRSYTREIQRAFEKIEERLERMGRRPHLVLDPYDLREVHIHYSVAEACKGLVTGAGDIWWDLWKEYEQKGDTVMDRMNFKYDSSADGFISGGETDKAARKLRPVRM